MTTDELLKLLRENKFRERDTGQEFRYIDNSINVNGKPLSHFEIYEESGNFYMKGAGLTNEDLLLTINVTGIGFKGKSNGRSYLNLIKQN